MRRVYSSITGVLLLLVLFFLPKSVYAASLTISSGSAELKNTDEYTVQLNLSINAQDATQYYLRAVFAKEGSTNYCGLTWNGSAWFNGPYSTNNGWKNFLPVTITNNSWSGQLKAKIDQGDSGCIKSGTYIFKIERFTTSGSGSFDVQNEQKVEVTLPSPTPTPQPSPSPQPTTPAIKSINANKTTLSYEVTSGVTTSPSNNITYEPTSITPTVSIEPNATFSGVLGESSVETDTPTVLPKKEKTEIKGIARQNFPLYLLLGGMLLFITCGIVAFQIIRKRNRDRGSS